MFHFLHQMSSAGLTPAIISIQDVSITFSTTETSNTATINAVDTSRSVIIYNGVRMASNASSNSLFASVELTNSTTVTATRDSTLTTVTTINATIIEFSPKIIKSIQSSSITLSGTTSATSSISSVDTSLAIALFTGQTTTVNTIDRSIATVSLDNSTTVKAQKGDSSDSMTVYFSVIEFTKEVIQSIQPVSVTLSDPELTKTAIITNVDTDNAVLFFQGNHLTGSRTTDIYALYAYLDNGTDLIVQRNATDTSVDVVINITVVEFNPQLIHQVQRGRTTIPTNENYADAIISSVNLDKSYISYLGFCSTKADHLEDHHYATVEILNDTTIRVERGDDPQDTEITVSWETISFK